MSTIKSSQHFLSMAKNKRNMRKSRRQNRSSSYTGDGVRTLHGQQIIQTVQNGANGTQLFVGTNVAPISPDSVGGIVARLANEWNQYKFTRLEFRYRPTNYTAVTTGPTGSQTNNIFAFGYESDGQQTFTVTHDSIAGLQHSMQVPAEGWTNDRQNHLVVRPKDQWYYTKDDTTSSATIRQTIQGLIYGEAWRSITDVTLYGYIHLRYTIKFRDMCPNQGVSLSSLMKEASLGQSSQLRFVLNCVKHAVIAGRAGELPEELKKTLGNEELLALTGHGRSVDPSLSKEKKPNWPDLYKCLGAEFAPVACL